MAMETTFEVRQVDPRTKESKRVAAFFDKDRAKRLARKKCKTTGLPFGVYEGEKETFYVYPIFNNREK